MERSISMDAAASRLAVAIDNCTGNVFIIPTVVAVNDSFVHQSRSSSSKSSYWLVLALSAGYSTSK
ncbi:hypothetical protein FRX31_030203, partial [Thalictrum thalictroides]